MRILVALLLVSAATLVATPPAAACHPEPLTAASAPSKDLAAPGYYVVPGVGVGGCPHTVTVCPQVWRETNGEPGLQRTGSNPDTAILVVCPLP